MPVDTPRRGGPTAPARALEALLGASLLGMLLFALVRPDLPQFTGKAMGARLLLYPLALAVVPVGTALVRRAARRRTGRDARRVAHPHLVGALVLAPFVLDLVGNAAGWYVRFEHFDDAVHAVNPALLVAALAAVLQRTGAPRWTVWIMAVGLGCVGHIAWEGIEYVLLVAVGAVELGLTLPDTLSDLSWGVLGSLAGTALALALARHEVPPRPVAGTRPA